MTKTPPDIGTPSGAKRACQIGYNSCSTIIDDEKRSKERRQWIKLRHELGSADHDLAIIEAAKRLIAQIEAGEPLQLDSEELVANAPEPH